MRYRTLDVRDVRPGNGHASHRRAEGTIVCLDAADGTTGPNRVPVARYTGPVQDFGEGWEPIGCRGDYPERWTDV